MNTRFFLRFMFLGTLAVLMPVQASAQTTAPAITTQPASLTVAAGANASFNVVATGTAPLTYQWSKNATAISGATSATLTFAAAAAADAGSYTVTVTNTAGSVTSAAATLTVTPVAATTPAITTQPASQTVAAGANASFNVVATGTAPLTYQWSKNATAISGATSATLTFAAAAAADAGSYTVTVTNTAGSVTSAAATLTVTPVVATAPAITTQPASQTVAAGANASFSVVATGTAPLTYQWSKGGTVILGATSATLTLNAVAAEAAGSYTVTVTNTAGSVTSTAATLTVTPVVAGAPTITTQPMSQTVAAGANVSFVVVAAGTAPLTYQWSKGDTAITGATSATLTLNAVTADAAGSYKVKVTNSAGNVTSNAATLTVTTIAATAPAITTQPASQVVAAGTKVTFTVAATGTAPLRYQWFRDGHEFEFERDGSASSATLTLASARVSDAAVYTVRVSNSAGSVTSAPASLAVNVVANTVTTAPASVTVDAGKDATFTVATAGTGLTYQWRFNGRLVKGATDATLKVTNAGTLSDGTYAVTVSNATGVAAAAAAELTLHIDARLTNIATRGHVGEDDEVLISGFVIREARGTPATKKILLRAVGPTLSAQFKVTDALANPTLTLFRGGRVVDTNSTWGGGAILTAAFTQVGAFPLAATSADAALLETLGSGAYTATVTAPKGKDGVALVEVYDSDTGSPTTEIANISTRALVGSEVANTLIAGFAVTGTTSDTVLIRGAGPSLGTLFGMRRALGASHVAVYDSKGNLVAENTVWGKSKITPDRHGDSDLRAADRGDDDDEAEDDDKESDIDEASDRAGAWHFPHGSIDSALLLTLAPGVYTAHVTGVKAQTGIALVEIFEVH